MPMQNKGSSGKGPTRWTVCPPPHLLAPPVGVPVHRKIIFDTPIQITQAGRALGAPAAGVAPGTERWAEEAALAALREGAAWAALDAAVRVVRGAHLQMVSGDGSVVSAGAARLASARYDPCQWRRPAGWWRRQRQCPPPSVGHRTRHPCSASSPWRLQGATRETERRERLRRTKQMRDKQRANWSGETITLWLGHGSAHEERQKRGSDPHGARGAGKAGGAALAWPAG